MGDEKALSRQRFVGVVVTCGCFVALSVAISGLAGACRALTAFQVEQGLEIGKLQKSVSDLKIVLGAPGGVLDRVEADASFHKANLQCGQEGALPRAPGAGSITITTVDAEPAGPLPSWLDTSKLYCHHKTGEAHNWTCYVKNAAHAGDVVPMTIVAGSGNGTGGNGAGGAFTITAGPESLDEHATDDEIKAFLRRHPEGITKDNYGRWVPAPAPR